MMFYEEQKHLYLKTDASGIVLEAGLLKMRDGIWLPMDEASDNSTLQPIAFVSKGLTSSET